MQIILDISANTHKNDEAYYKRMIDELAKVDTRKHEVILKWQLFTRERGDNTLPDPYMFFRMSEWAFHTHGYKTTTSVFDLPSLDYLLSLKFPYKLPFIKIANDRSLDYLIGEIPRKYQVYKSVGTKYKYENDEDDKWNLFTLFCVSEYPAPIEKYGIYEDKYGYIFPRSISDHTIGLELFKLARPHIFEKHYKLEDSTGLDAGDFAITPQELRSIL